MTRILYKQWEVADLPGRYIPTLKSLTIPGFMMKPLFEDCLENGEGYVIIALERDVPVGWSLLTPGWIAPEGKYLAAFYVREDRRRSGIGAELARRAEHVGVPLVYRANEDNFPFFESVGFMRVGRWQEQETARREGRVVASCLPVG